VISSALNVQRQKIFAEVFPLAVLLEEVIGHLRAKEGIARLGLLGHQALDHVLEG